jgi:Glycosyl hydrolase family 3 C-terminal domain
MTMPGDFNFGSGISYWGGNLTVAVLNGTIPQWRIDDMAVRIMAAYFKVGRDSARVPTNFDSWTNETFGNFYWQGQEDFTQVNDHLNVQDDHARLIREIGGRSTVLLKNTGNALPLGKPVSIAVIGEDAHPNPSGPNSCPDRGCDIGTLAMGWGSGTANFPYLVAPVDALRARAVKDKSAFTNVSNSYDLAAAAAAARGAEAALVFANSDAGESYITVDNNAGDRKNLTLWGGGDALISTVAANNKNTIVVLHTVGPVLVEDIKNHPNVTAILWAGLPGQESGNAITDVLYGVQNPAAKTVFTWGKQRSDWGVDVFYTSSLDNPQSDFTEGNFIDYRYFDAHNIEPSYEFGFGLSYTTFEYSNLKISKMNPGSYEPTTGMTEPAPTFGTIDYNVADNEFPSGFHAVSKFVYPYVTEFDRLTGGGIVPPGSQDGTPQPKLGSGGSAGGNRQLYDALYEVTADVKNTGSVDGIEVVQLVSLFFINPFNHHSKAIKITDTNLIHK